MRLAVLSLAALAAVATLSGGAATEDFFFPAVAFFPLERPMPG